MNLVIKRIFQFLLVNNINWLLLRPFVYVSKRLSLSRVNYENRKIEDENFSISKILFKEKKVLNGLFKGLQYNDVKATGSSIYAKLLGSYELEIMPAIEKLLAKRYDNFINIGCDEGYYAVSIARILPDIKVDAFDCNKKAQKRCKTLAMINKVQDRVVVRGCFSPEELLSYEKQSKILFLIDCEGCENEIVSKKLIQIFRTADFIIELHYRKHPLILSKLKKLFAETHKITLIKALSDHERVMIYQFPELADLTYEQKKFILNERNEFMEWFIAESII